MPMLPTPKSRARALGLPLVNGGDFVLHEQTPEAFQILVFYRGLHCPKCKDYLRDIERRYEALCNQGLSIVAISMDSKDRAETTKSDWDLKNLPVAHSLGLLDAKAYGLFISDGRPDSNEPDLFSEPALFVIKPDGAIYAEYVQNTPFGRPPIADIAAGLDYVIQHDYPTRGTSVA